MRKGKRSLYVLKESRVFCDAEQKIARTFLEKGFEKLVEEVFKVSLLQFIFIRGFFLEKRKYTNT